MNAIKRIAVLGVLMLSLAAENTTALAQQAAGVRVEEQDVLYFNQQVPPPGPGVQLDRIGPIVGQAVGQAVAGIGPMVGEAVGSAMTQAFTFVSAIGPGPGKLVTGAPYSAESTTEMVQTLADGNRITHKNSAMVYRDGQGRTRRDQTLEAIGPIGTAVNPPNLTFITDPVAKVQWVLDNNARTARETTLPDGPPNGMPVLPPYPLPPGGAGPNVMMFRGQGAGLATGMATGIGGPMGPPPGAPGVAFGAAQSTNFPTPVNEDLGKQTIEGIETTGTRSTITFPAGTFGNELPIQVVSERWYSDALQEVIVSTHSDPRSGKTIYKLTSISRNEPAKTLFEVPAGYTLTHAPVVSATGYADCVTAGGTVKDGPPQCTTADGKSYIKPLEGGSGPRLFTAPLPAH